MRKNSEVPLVVGGIIVLVGFAVFLLGIAHKTTPVMAAGAQAAVTSASQPDVSPESGMGPKSTSDLAGSRQPDGDDSAENSYASRRSGVIHYCNAVNDGDRRIARALNDLTDARNAPNTDPGLYSDPAWRDRVAKAVGKVNDAAFALENIGTVPLECVPMQQKVQQLASDCNIASREIADGVENSSDVEIAEGMKLLSHCDARFDAIDADERRLEDHYARQD